MSNNNQFNIVTYNIEYAAQKGKILENIIQLEKDGVDIFCFQELINTPQEGFFIDTVLQKLGDSWQAVYNVGEMEGRLSLGNAIVWNKKKFFLKSSEKILLPLIKNFDLHEKLWYKTIRVPGVPIQRRAITCLFTLNQTPIRVTSVHVDNVGGPTHRKKQLAFLMTKLRLLETPKQEIICGDFNTFDLLKTGYEKKMIQNEIGEDFVDASNKIAWTSDIAMIDFSTSIKIFPWFIKAFNIHIRRRLDYIWVKNFTIQECKKLEIIGSDHFPIIAKLEIPK